MSTYDIEKLTQIINLIPKSDWETFKISPIFRSLHFYNLEWWNCKSYIYTDCFDGTKTQKALNGKLEIPEERKGKESSSRFGLSNRSVSYWARDYIVAVCEITDALRHNENLTFNEVKKNGLSKTLNHKNILIHPINGQVKRGVNLLDLSTINCKFLSILKGLGIDNSDELYYSVISSRNSDSYPVTKVIAEKAFENGFQGIIYTSVRKITDTNFNGLCLVSFEDKAMIPWDSEYWRKICSHFR